MKQIYPLLAAVLMVMSASARTDVDFSSRFDDPDDPEINTITAENAWGWYNVFLPMRPPLIGGRLSKQGAL